jgi:hypothetical protein
MALLNSLQECPLSHPLAFHGCEKNPFWNFTFQNGWVIDGNFDVDSGQTATKTRGVQEARFPEKRYLPACASNGRRVGGVPRYFNGLALGENAKGTGMPPLLSH